MFAFAIWDRKDRRLTLARDRLGIKPLYLGRQNGRIVFASELKAFEALPGWKGELNEDALASYLRLSYVPSPHSIYRGIDKLAPGHIATIDPKRARSRRAPIGVSPMSRARDMHLLSTLAMREATDMLEALLGDAVKRRLVADVPLGAFLSGGINSSTVAAMMRANSTSPVQDLFDRLR